MAVRKPPSYVCKGCGSVCPDAVALPYWEDAVGAEAIERRKRKDLLAEQDSRGKLRRHKHYDVAMEVLSYWRDSCRPKARELEGGDRLKNCLARLDHGTKPEHLKMAVYGYSLKPFVINGKRTHEGPPDSWYADAELIFRTEKHVATGIDIAKRAGELERAFTLGSDVEGAPNTYPSENGSLSDLAIGALKVVRTFPVFPVWPQDKRPMTKHGLKDAKKDPAAVEAFWRTKPNANIGVPTGMVSGIVVLDVDGEQGLDSLHELEDTIEELPTTLSVVTPRGGQHLYFEHPGNRNVQNSASLLGPALDVRGDGGYVLAPPSVGANGEKYVVDEEVKMAPMPEWLLDLIDERQKTISDAFKASDYRKVFEGAHPGQRNDLLFRFACSLIRKHDVTTAAGIVHGMNIAYLKPPLDDREVDSIIKSALKQKDRRDG